MNFKVSLCSSVFLVASLVSSARLSAGEGYSSGKEVFDKVPMEACGPFYIEVFGGATFAPELRYAAVDYEMLTGFNFGGAVGKSVTDQLDVEFEIYYSETGYEGFVDDFSSLGFMANVFYNVPLGQRLTGYAGVGLGALNIEYRDATTHSSDLVAGYQGIVGLRYAMSDCAKLFVEYRHIAGFDDAFLYGTDNAEFRSNDISVGVRFYLK